MEEKLRGVFANSLNIPPERVVDGLSYGKEPAWDSVAHMALVAAIEGAFDVMIETGDVIDMSSFLKARQIVAKLTRN